MFLLSAAALLSARNVLLERRYGLLSATSLALVSSFLAILILSVKYGYNHFDALPFAASYENPSGFQGASDPFSYSITRLEGVAEIALFLSIGCVTALFHREWLRVSLLDYGSTAGAVALSGGVSLALMLLAGAYRNGETARACLYIYPYLILFFRNMEHDRLRDLALLAGMQTATMQVFGNFFW